MDGMGYVEFQLSKTSRLIWGCCMNYTGAWRSLVCFQDIFSPKICFLWEDHRQYANATDVNSKTTLPKTNTSHLKMDAWNCRLDSIPFGGRPIFSGANLLAVSFFWRGVIFLASYIKPLKITSSDEVTHLLPPKTHKTPRSSGFLLQCIGASKKDGFLVEVGWGPWNLSLPPDGSGNRKSSPR